MNTLHARLWSGIRIGSLDDCWEWKRGCNNHGYGQLQGNDSKLVLAHRAVYEEYHGPIPVGMKVLHNCPDGDNPACCNPCHLWLGTQAENMADMAKKGRQWRPKGSLQWSAKLSEEQAVFAMARLLTGRETHQEIADTLAVTREAISSLWRGKSWGHLFTKG